MAAETVTNERRGGAPWWLVLIEGILAIIVGILLWIYPVRTFIWLALFIGVYWLISGIFDIISIFFNRAMWGWKLFMGIVGILAGLFLIYYPLRGSTSLAYITALTLGFMGVFYGILGLVRAFQGAGWGTGILGVVSIIFGFFILANPLASSLSIPWLFGLLGIFGGFLAIFGAFALRSAEKARKAAAARVSVPTMARATQAGEVAAAPAIPDAPTPAGVAAAGVAAAEVVKAEAVETPVEAGVAAVEGAMPESVEAPNAAGVAAVEGFAPEIVEESNEAGVAAVEGFMPEVGEPQTAADVAVVEEATPGVIGTVALGTAAAEVAKAETVETPVEADFAAVEGVGPEVGEAPVEAVTAAVEGIAEAPGMAEAGETPAAAEEELEVVEIPNFAEIPEEQVRFLKQDIEYVEGIGPAYGAKLKAIGVGTTLELLSKGATRKGRELIAEASGISIKLILRWVNHADLFRVKGVGSEWADLLEAAGVDTVVELAARNPANLHNKMVATNVEKKLTRQVPSAAQVENWVEQAKTLGRVVRY